MANEVALTEGPAQVASLFVPTQQRQLLIPNVTVAELIGFVTPKPRENAPYWLLGDMEWRNTIIPVVSLEAFNGDNQPSHGFGQRIAVLNGVSNQKNLPFWAIVTQGIPRLVKVEEEAIRELPEESVNSSDSMIVEIGGEKAAIPNLDKIEKQLVDLI